MQEALIYIVFLLIGAYLGRLGVRNTNTPDEVKTPNLNPFSAYREYKDKKEESEQERKYKIMLDNINNYDGSSNGQKDIK